MKRATSRAGQAILFLLLAIAFELYHRARARPRLSWSLMSLTLLAVGVVLLAELPPVGEPPSAGTLDDA